MPQTYRPSSYALPTLGDLKNALLNIDTIGARDYYDINDFPKFKAHLLSAIEAIDETFLLTGEYQTKEMTLDGKHRHQKEKGFISKDQRERYYLLQPKDEKFYRDVKFYRVSPFTTSSGIAYSDEPTAMFVMNKVGDFYGSVYRKHNEFHHSTLYDGKPVALAGQIEVYDGVVHCLSNSSGHYLHKLFFLFQGLHRLNALGMSPPYFEVNHRNSLHRFSNPLYQKPN